MVCKLRFLASCSLSQRLPLSSDSWHWLVKAVQDCGESLARAWLSWFLLFFVSRQGERTRTRKLYFTRIVVRRELVYYIRAKRERERECVWVCVREREIIYQSVIECTFIFLFWMAIFQVYSTYLYIFICMKCMGMPCTHSCTFFVCVAEVSLRSCVSLSACMHSVDAYVFASRYSCFFFTVSEPIFWAHVKIRVCSMT